MQRYIISLFIILVTVWAGCSFIAAGETNKVAATVASATPVNLPAEIARAKAEHKLLLLEFGSSDACPPCILFEQEVASKPEFQTFEKANLVFVRLDFPQRSQLPPAVQTTNLLLAHQFEAFGFPTFIALNRDGKEFWRMPAKDDPNPGIPNKIFNPQGFISLIESVKKLEK